MAKAAKAKQITISLVDRMGLLSEVTKALADAKVNLSAICAWGMDNQASFMMLADNSAKAKKALAPLKGKVDEDDVIVVEMPDRPGELQKIAEKVANAGVNIWYMYATAGSKTRSTAVIKTENDRKAITAINK